MLTDLLSAFLQVLVVNIVLSGDNAVVIGLAARELEPRQRRRAILLGGGLAVLLRLALTIPAEIILNIPFLRAVGGIVLAWVAYSLLETSEEEEAGGEAASVWAAVRLIVVADATMSLDNVLAVAAVAEQSPHSILVLTVGLLLSIPVVLLGGGVVAHLMARLPWLAWVGAAILGYTAADLISGDQGVRRWVSLSSIQRIAFGILVTLLIVGAAGLRARAARRVAPPFPDRESPPPRGSTREDFDPHRRSDGRGAHG